MQPPSLFPFKRSVFDYYIMNDFFHGMCLCRDNCVINSVNIFFLRWSLCNINLILRIDLYASETQCPTIFERKSKTSKKIVPRYGLLLRIAMCHFWIVLENQCVLQRAFLELGFWSWRSMAPLSASLRLRGGEACWSFVSKNSG